MKLNFYDQQHITRMIVQEQRVNAIFNRFISLVSPELRKWKQYNINSVWVRNPYIENAIDRHLIWLKEALLKEIEANQNTAWKSANTKNDEVVEAFIKNLGLSSMVRNGMFAGNLNALTTLQKRIDNGLNLSQRVWKITEQTKTNIEFFLESGIASGRSADAIGRDIKQMLENPEKRFRRVRNEDGKLVYSKPMKDYNPGRGVYRSSKMNAIRVAATGTNLAYRMGDAERWKQLDFVLGYDVERSRNGHPCVICDALVGRYPKDFVFPGFHPFCICHATPVLMDHDDFADYLLTNKFPKEKYVKGIPSGAESFISENPQYLENSYFGKYNQSYFQKD